MGKVYLSIFLIGLFFSCNKPKKKRHGGGKEFRIELYLENNDKMVSPELSNFNTNVDSTGIEGS